MTSPSRPSPPLDTANVTSLSGFSKKTEEQWKEELRDSQDRKYRGIGATMKRGEVRGLYGIAKVFEGLTGKKADVVLLKNDASPVSFPLLNPYGHVAFQAQRGDVHTVIVDGRVVKDAGRLVGFDPAAVRRDVDATIDHLRSAMGEETWEAGMHPELPEGSKVLDNPYQYTEYQSESTHGARGSMFGDPGSGN